MTTQPTQEAPSSDVVEAAARAICEEMGRDPDRLEPGDADGIDGYENGEPCHYVWKHYVGAARAALASTAGDTLKAELDHFRNRYADKCGELVSADKRIAELEAALEQIAALNDLSAAPYHELEAAARTALYDCEIIARTALGSDQ